MLRYFYGKCNSYSSALTLTNANLTDVLSYLKANISNHESVAFVAEGNTYVFQDAGATDTLVELVGVSASSLSNTGLVAGAVWVV